MFIDNSYKSLILNEIEYLNKFYNEDNSLKKYIKDVLNMSEKEFLKCVLDNIIKSCEIIKKDNGIE